MKLKFEFLGETQIMAKFNRLAEKISDYSDVFEKLGDDFYEIEKRLFGSQGGSGDKGKWKALSPKYAAWKSKNYPGQPILVQTGELRDSLTQKGGQNIRAISRKQAVFGTYDEKAIYHQQGSGKLPKRRPIDLNEQDKSRWMKIVHEFIVHTSKMLGL